LSKVFTALGLANKGDETVKIDTIVVDDSEGNKGNYLSLGDWAITISVQSEGLSPSRQPGSGATRYNEGPA